MDIKKLVLIAVTVIAAVVSLVMINNLINRQEKSPETAVAPVSAPAASVQPAAAPSAGVPAQAVAEEDDPKSYSGPLLR